MVGPGHALTPSGRKFARKIRFLNTVALMTYIQVGMLQKCQMALKNSAPQV
jgi:hypothetical protein